MKEKIQEGPSYCACPELAPGDVSQGGWHMRRVPDDAKFAKEYYGHESYAGTLVAVEQCQAYQKAMREGIEARRQAGIGFSKQQETQGRRYGR